MKESPRLLVTPEERYHMINDAAYFRALKLEERDARGRDPDEPWREVESEIDEVLARHHAT